MAWIALIWGVLITSIAMQYEENKIKSEAGRKQKRAPVEPEPRFG
jgi:hypothetical protein